MGFFQLHFSGMWISPRMQILFMLVWDFPQSWVAVEVSRRPVVCFWQPNWDLNHDLLLRQYVWCHASWCLPSGSSFLVALLSGLPKLIRLIHYPRFYAYFSGDPFNAYVNSNISCPRPKPPCPVGSHWVRFLEFQTVGVIRYMQLTKLKDGTSVDSWII